LLREALETVPGVQAAAIFGSWARGDVDAESDVDLLVVGDVDYPSLTSKLTRLQERIGREISVVWMRPGELPDALANGSAFATELRSSPMRTLIGDMEGKIGLAQDASA
jgi:predicted nucleotidyltransferase